MFEDAPGKRIGSETNAYVSAEEKIRPILDRIILEPLEWQPSEVIRVAYAGRPVRGKVIAVGPGRHPLKYNGRKGQRSKMWHAKHFVPMEVKVGDVVELGGIEQGLNELRGYAFPTFLWGTKEYMVIREGDVTGIVES